MLRKLLKKTVNGPSVLALFILLMLAPALAAAQRKDATGSTNSEIANNGRTISPAKEKSATNVVMPVYTDYKGVTIGMSADEVRQKLQKLKEKGKDQDFFVFSDNETAQVFYDTQGKVMAISRTYVGDKSGAPDVKSVLGEDIAPQADGSIYKMVRYPEAGYWVSYNRSAGDSPVVTITMQKFR